MDKEWSEGFAIVAIMFLTPILTAIVLVNIARAINPHYEMDNCMRNYHDYNYCLERVGEENE